MEMSLIYSQKKKKKKIGKVEGWIGGINDWKGGDK